MIEGEPQGDARKGGRLEPSVFDDVLGFAWHESYTRILEGIESPLDQWEMAKAIIAYGAHGTYPDLEPPYSLMFEGIRPNLESSRKASLRSRKRETERARREAEEEQGLQGL